MAGFRSFNDRMASLEQNDMGLVTEAFSKADLDKVIPKLARVVGRTASDTLYRYVVVVTTKSFKRQDQVQCRSIIPNRLWKSNTV